MQEGKFPIVIDGEICGVVQTAKRGSCWMVDAECRLRSEILRLSLYDDETEGYLGVMVPENGKLHLRKTLSRAAAASFPETIVEAGPAGREKASIPDFEVKPEAPKTEIMSCETLWYSSPDGILYSFDGENSLVALPEDDTHILKDANGERREIEGKSYLVFKGRSIG